MKLYIVDGIDRVDKVFGIDVIDEIVWVVSIEEIDGVVGIAGIGEAALRLNVAVYSQATEYISD